MAKKKFDFTKLILPIALLTIGILFCFSNAMGTKALSVLLGVGFIVVGAIGVFASLYATRSMLSTYALGGCFLIAVGILIIIDNLVGLLLVLIPWLLIVYGSALIIDALFGVASKRMGTGTLFVIELLLGVALLTLGICLLTVTGFAEFTGLVFGISLIISAAYDIVLIVKKAK